VGGRPVFVLEDEAAVRTVLVDALASVGYDVRDFGDGQQALDEIERVVPDLILLDMRMPRMDGFAFLSALRRTRGAPRNSASPASSPSRSTYPRCSATSAP